MVNAVWRKTKSIRPTPLLLLAIRAYNCRFVIDLGRMPRAIMMTSVAAGSLKIATTSASEIHASSTPMRARAVGVKWRTLRKVLRRIALI
jgi:hypothetical protein